MNFLEHKPNAPHCLLNHPAASTQDLLPERAKKYENLVGEITTPPLQNALFYPLNRYYSQGARNETEGKVFQLRINYVYHFVCHLTSSTPRTRTSSPPTTHYSNHITLNTAKF